MEVAVNPSFTIDERGITIKLALESRYEKAVAKILKEFEVVSTTVQEVERAYYVADPDVQAVIFRLNRKKPA